MTPNLLRREVLGGPHHDVVAGEVFINPVETLCNSEVGEQHSAIFGDENVAGFDIAVNEARSMGSIKSGRNGRADMNGEFGPKAFLAIKDLSQASSLYQLHDDCLTAVMFEHIVN